MVATEKFLPMSHGTTRYFEEGVGEPVILIHGAGFLSGADGWLETMGPLSASFRCLAIDALNWGPGDVLNDFFSFAYLVDHVREFMDVLGLPTAHVVGHSMGGWIATLFAYESPERVNKLVLVAAGGAATRPLQNMVDFKVPTDTDITTQITERVQAAGYSPEPIVNEYLEKAHNAEQVEAFAKVMKHMTTPLTRERYNTLRRLPQIAAPTLILWGTADKTNDFSLGGEIQAGIKGSKLLAYEGTGHRLPQEQPDRFVRDVLAFLR